MSPPGGLQGSHLTLLATPGARKWSYDPMCILFGELCKTAILSVFGELCKTAILSVFGELCKTAILSVFGELCKTDLWSATIFSGILSAMLLSNVCCQHSVKCLLLVFCPIFALNFLSNFCCQISLQDHFSSEICARSFLLEDMIQLLY
jgi:hypothetical protein